jgi:hypothetical protein
MTQTTTFSVTNLFCRDSIFCWVRKTIASTADPTTTLSFLRDRGAWAWSLYFTTVIVRILGRFTFSYHIVYSFTVCCLGITNTPHGAASACQEIFRILWNPKFITMLKSARCMSLSCTRSSQSTPSQLISLRFFNCYPLIYAYVLQLVCFSVFPIETKYLLYPLRATCPATLTTFD